MKRIIAGLKELRFKKQIPKEVIRILELALPFILMDVFIRILSLKVAYSQWRMILPSILFTAVWILFIVLVSLGLKDKIGRVVYTIGFGLFFIIFLVNCVYFPYTNFFFSFNLLLLAGEGSAYILDTILSTNPLIFLVAFGILFLAIRTIKRFPKREKGYWKWILLVIGVFTIVRLHIPNLYGRPNGALEWDTWRNPRNVYENFNDANKSMKVCGLFEYSMRDAYLTFFQAKEKEDPNEIAFLDKIFEHTTVHAENEYTGIFEGKNVIFLQLEGIDSWLLNEKDMPNLYKLLNNSMVFNKHYSYYNGGGSTFNSELAVNAGLITPISYIQNAYTFNMNYYTYSMPKLFQQLGYNVNAFHMNKGEYYSRRLNYQNWGYENYYGLLDESSYKDVSYELDRELILNKSFYNKMFHKSEPFVHYIITYTPHTPYNTLVGKGLYLAEEKYGVGAAPVLSEEETVRLYASETDKMIELLMKALEDNGLIDNTVIVAYADHYLYTLGDKTILDKYKNTSNNLINETPFFIWSNGMDKKVFNKVNSQVDILPTVLNLFGIKYEEEHFLGKDILDPNYNGYVFFSDYSWYDGNVYVEDGEAVSGTVKDESYILQMNMYINELIKKNDLILKYDYFRKIKR